jgi:hypothetical protein
MLSRAKRLRNSINSFCIQEKEMRFHLSPSQWQHVDYLLCLTKPFFDFTNALSTSKTATIHQVFDIYQALSEHLDKAKSCLASKRVLWKKAVLNALETSHQKLYTYQRKTTSSDGNLYGIATLLAPDHRLQYFSGPTWEAGSQEKYHSLLKEEYRIYSESYTSLSTPNQPQIIQSSSLSDLLCSRNHARKAGQSDEIQAYLKGGIIDIDPLAFWAEHHKEYPILARIARDTLSIPATGAGVERMFNYARDICHYRRGSLKDSTIGSLMMYMCTSRFDSAEEFDRFTSEMAGNSSLEMQMTEAFELESMISDHEEDEEDEDRDGDISDMDGEPESASIQPPLASHSPPILTVSSDESEYELPQQEITAVRSSKRSRKGRDFYEGGV